MEIARRIQQRLREQGITEAMIARDLGVHRCTVNRVVHGKSQHPRVWKLLIELLNWEGQFDTVSPEVEAELERLAGIGPTPPGYLDTRTRRGEVITDRRQRAPGVPGVGVDLQRKFPRRRWWRRRLSRGHWLRRLLRLWRRITDRRG